MRKTGDETMRAAAVSMLVGLRATDGLRAAWAAGELWAATEQLRGAADVLERYTQKKKTRGDALRLLDMVLQTATSIASTLATATHRQWRRLHWVRLAQRITLRSIVRTSQRHGPTKLRGQVSDDLEQMCDSGAGGIYVRVNVHAHRWRYVGQTACFRTRDEQHLRHEHEQGGGDEAASRYYDVAKRLGGPGAWIDLPLCILQAEASPRTRLRVEREWITTLGSLNGRRRHTVGVSGPRTAAPQRRGRAPMRLRQGGAERHGGTRRRHGVRLYTVAGTEAADFGEVLTTAERRGEPTEVQVAAGRDVSRIKFITDNFGDTDLLIRYNDGLVLASQVNDLLWLPARAHKIGLEQVTAIRIQRVVRTSSTRDQVVLRTGMPDKTIEHVIVTLSKRANKRVHRTLGGMTYEDVRRVWARTRDIRSREHRKICRGNLQRYARRVWGVAIKHRTTLRVETMSREVAQIAKTAARRVIAATAGPIQLKACLTDEIRPVRTRPKTVIQDLGNWRKHCAQMDGTVEAASQCQ